MSSRTIKTNNYGITALTCALASWLEQRSSHLDTQLSRAKLQISPHSIAEAQSTLGEASYLYSDMREVTSFCRETLKPLEEQCVCHIMFPSSLYSIAHDALNAFVNEQQSILEGSVKSPQVMEKTLPGNLSLIIAASIIMGQLQAYR